MDFIKALIEFFTDLFSALADFLGWTVDLSDLTELEDDLEDAVAES